MGAGGRKFSSGLAIVTGYIAGAAAAIPLHSIATLPAAGLTAVALLAAAVLKRKTRLSLPLLVMAFTALGLFLGSGRLLTLQGSLLEGLHGRRVVLEAAVSELPRSRGSKISFVADARAVQWADGSAPASEDVLVETFCHESCPPPWQSELKEGTRLRIRGALKEPPASPGADFDYGLYLRRRGINVVVSTSPDGVEVLPGGRGGIGGLVDRLREHSRASLDAGDFGAAESLLKGMVLGDDREVPGEVIEDFRDSGLLHMLAVSGQNVVLLALVVMMICRILLIGRIPAAAIAALIVCLYVPLTGAGPSIIRAGIVGVLGLMAVIISRQTSPYHFLALAAAAILTLNPYSLLDPGFQLSFAAVLAIFLVAPALAAPLGFLPGPLREAVTIAAAAGLVTAPITLAHFQQVSLVTVPANVAAAPVAGVVMLLGVVSIIVSPALPLAGWLLNAAASVCTAYLIEVAHLFAVAPGATYEGKSPGVVAIALFYCILTGMVVAARYMQPGALLAIIRRRRPALAVAMVVVALLIGIACMGGGQAGAPPQEFTVSILDVGQGDAILIQDPEGATILIDGGPGSSVTDRLQESGVTKLDAVILSHPHADHLAGLASVIDKYPVAAVYDAGSPSSSPLYRDFLKLIQEKGIAYSVLRQGRVLSFGELVMQVLSPGERQSEDDMNANSIVIAASFRGLDILCPGDAEGNVLAALDLPQVEVFKVGHHGSRDGQLKPVLDAIRPRVAVISAGTGNSYGHPAEDTLAKLKVAGAETYRTDTQGTVRVILAGGHMEVQTGR